MRTTARIGILLMGTAAACSYDATQLAGPPTTFDAGSIDQSSRGKDALSGSVDVPTGLGGIVGTGGAAGAIGIGGSSSGGRIADGNTDEGVDLGGDGASAGGATSTGGRKASGGSGSSGGAVAAGGTASSSAANGGSGGASNSGGNTSTPDCTDVVPPSNSCSDWKSWNQCSTMYMVDGHFCDKTCGRCSGTAGVGGSGGALPSGGSTGTSVGGASGHSISTLASGQNTPWALAVDDANVYWTTLGSNGGSNGTVMKVPSASGQPPTALATGQGLEGGGIAVDRTNVYWVANNGNAIMTVPIVGGTPVIVASGQHLGTIAVDAGTVYWTTSLDPGAVMAMPTGGGTASTIASGQHYPGALAVGAGRFCWTTLGTIAQKYSDGAVTCMPTSGMNTSPTVFASSQLSPSDLAITSSSVYWAAESTAATSSGVALFSASTAGSVPKMVTSDSGDINLATDGTSLYLTKHGDGTVMKLTQNDTTLTTLATGQVGPGAIAVDATSVYWINISQGTVMKLTPK